MLDHHHSLYYLIWKVWSLNATVLFPTLCIMSITGGSLLKYLIKNRENLMACTSTDDDEVVIIQTAYVGMHYIYRSINYVHSYCQYVYKLERECNTWREKA